MRLFDHHSWINALQLAGLEETRFHDFQAFGEEKLGGALFRQEVDELFKDKGFSGDRLDIGADPLSQSFVGHAHHCCLLHGGMLGNQLLDFKGDDGLSPSFDEVFFSAGDNEVSAAVQLTNIPGTEKPSGVKASLSSSSDL